MQTSYEKEIRQIWVKSMKSTSQHETGKGERGSLYRCFLSLNCNSKNVQWNPVNVSFYPFSSIFFPFILFFSLTNLHPKSLLFYSFLNLPSITPCSLPLCQHKHGSLVSWIGSQMFICKETERGGNVLILTWLTEALGETCPRTGKHRNIIFSVAILKERCNTTFKSR